MVEALVFSDPMVGNPSFPLPAFVSLWADTGLDPVWMHAAAELDIVTAPEPALREPQSHAGLVVLDPRELAFIDSSGAHAVVRARQVGRRVVLQRGPHTCTLTGSSDDLEIGDTHPAEPHIGALLHRAEQELAS
jgi:anti-anti-sigma regulatory factor